MNPDKSPKTHRSTRERGKAPGQHWKRSPVREPPARMRGLPRRLLKREGQDWEGAIAWAQAQDWWPLVVNERKEPYNDHRWYIFVLREEPTP